MRLAYYISDHGYGHASRSLSIISKLLKVSPEIEMSINTKVPLPYIRRHIEYLITDIPDFTTDQVVFHEVRNDFGLIPNNTTGKIDYEKTKVALREWLNSWQDYFLQEFTYLKKFEPDLILSDISPQCFELGSKLDCTTAAISNFTWLDLYPKRIMTKTMYQKLLHAYREASLVFVLPLNFSMDYFRSKISCPLVALESTNRIKSLRAKYKSNTEDLLVYVGFGKSLDKIVDVKTAILTIKTVLKNASFIVPDSVESEDAKIVTIPKNDPNPQDYIAISDLAIVKSGYSSVAECIRSKVPFMIYDIVHSKESILIQKYVENLPMVQSFSIDDFISGKLTEESIREFIARSKISYEKLPKRYARNGEDYIATQILSLLEE